MSKIWTPIKMGNIELKHRLSMAPMTRSRAFNDGTPSKSAAEYYSQRASFGLIITEGTQPSLFGKGYMNTPGIYTDKHVNSWRKVINSVHDAGGYIYMQIMHVGRISHPDNTLGAKAVAPSAIAPGTQIYTANGMQHIPEPKALTIQEIQTTIDDFRRAAALAIEAGADGVEIHAANGYLIQQFLSLNSNTRNDAYGGNATKRMRFALEVVDAVVTEIGAKRTGIRLSPGSSLGGINEGAEYPAVYRDFVSLLANRDLSYLHIAHQGNEALLKELRKLWPGILIVNRPNRLLENIDIDIDSGLVDIVSVGRWALSNPDFAYRLRIKSDLNEADASTFYGGNEVGYTDYPSLYVKESLSL